MGFLIRHRVVLGGIAIGLLGWLYELVTAPVVNAGYVVGALVASLAIYGAIGGFIVWIVSSIFIRGGKPNA
jgi:ABC-type multidrug transport system permease subunit